MNVLFLTLAKISKISDSAIYTDLIREFSRHGDCIYVVTPLEKRDNAENSLEQDGNCWLLKINIGNYFNTGLIEKGLTLLTLERDYREGIKRYFPDIRFDLVLYSTPPISFNNVVSYVKKRDMAKTYLMLKDIFPQNAVDLGMMSKTGVKGLLYKCFRRKEKKLYAVSDRIGCISPANVSYLLRQDPELAPSIVGICPNSIEVQKFSLTEEERNSLRKKYGLPQDKLIYVYGGNLGKPQDIPFIIECLKTQEHNEEVFFLLVGKGTEFPKLETYIEQESPQNVKLLTYIPKEDYDRLVAACDVGLIFLDHRFTIPNFPSRLLDYMQESLPVLACTDVNTDVGRVIEEGGFGWWCESSNPGLFAEKIAESQKANLPELGKRGRQYLEEHYTVQKAYQTILDSFSS